MSAGRAGPRRQPHGGVARRGVLHRPALPCPRPAPRTAPEPRPAPRPPRLVRVARPPPGGGGAVRIRPPSRGGDRPSPGTGTPRTRPASERADDAPLVPRRPLARRTPRAAASAPLSAPAPAYWASGRRCRRRTPTLRERTRIRVPRPGRRDPSRRSPEAVRRPYPASARTRLRPPLGGRTRIRVPPPGRRDPSGQSPEAVRPRALPSGVRLGPPSSPGRAPPGGDPGPGALALGGGGGDLVPAHEALADPHAARARVGFQRTATGRGRVELSLAPARAAGDPDAVVPIRVALVHGASVSRGTGTAFGRVANDHRRGVRPAGGV